MIDEADVVIIGCGPAGLTAAVFCGRANLKTVVIGNPAKSQAELAMHIQNYFGFPEGIDGPVLLAKGITQAQNFGALIIKDEVVNATMVEEGGSRAFIVKTSKGQNFRCRAMIIATGIPIRLSGIGNEEKLTGKGVHYCVNCDGPLYKDKKIAIVGNGNHAAEDAIEALSFTKDITIISNAPSFEFSDTFTEEIKKWQIATMCAKIKTFKGEKWFEGIILDTGKELPFNGVFMACGVAGALDFSANLGLDIKDNILVVDANNMTSMEGVFAAGNCAGRCRQIAKNVGDGCNAAVSAIKYLRSKELYFDYVHTMSSLSAQNKTSAEKEPLSQKPQTMTPPAPQQKLRVGWFSFSCCEDNTIVFTELLNDYYDKLKNIIDIRYSRILRKKNDMKNLDIAFVEGAISNERAATELRRIRKNCKKLVAIGACAVTGMPSGQRNMFDERKKKEIQPIVRAFDYSKKVRTLHELVIVDDSVPGCPMTENAFLATLGRQLKEFGINAQL